MRHLALMAGLCLGVGLSGAALADPAASVIGSVGVMAHPCEALPPMPAAAADYLAKMIKAEANHQPSPSIPAEAVGPYLQWQKAHQAGDFADLCHYDAENAALPPSTARRVVYFGDSITELWKVRDPAFFTGEVLDRGVSGQTTSQMLIRFNADVVALHPRVVHIMAGTNDIAGNTGPTSIAWIENNLRAMVELAKANQIQVVLASIPPAAKFAWRPQVAAVQPIATVNAWLKAYAREQGLTYVDYYSALDDGQHGFKSAWTLDGVHPNRAGYAVMDPLATQAVHQAMAGR